ncbi:MAG: VWA domain-containing protein, partial [Thermoguttaceae bacterium]
KIELAKDAAKAAVELLSPRDFVSVIAFDHEVYPIVPIQNVSSPAMINSTISTIESAGGTAMYPPMVEAYQQLNRVSAKLKHVILLTDGHSEPGDFEGITRQMAGAQITVSTVGVVDADNDLLKTIADIGQGRHYVCNDPQSVPQVFAKETMTASKSAIHELPFVPITVTPTDVLSGIYLDTSPPLLGFVVTRPKPTSQFILATETGEPLLAWWRYGLGLSVAFTSDAKSRWAAEWLTWPDFAQFWAQIIRHSMRKSDSRGTMIELVQHGGKIHLTLDAVDDNESYVNRADGNLTVIAPNLAKEEIKLVSTAPGRYEASVTPPKRGGYHFQMSLQSGEKNVVSQSRGVMVGYPDELHLKSTNTDLLQRIAATTGGVDNPLPESLFSEDATRTAWRVEPLWPYLLSAALLLYVLDVLLRRVDFSRKLKV